ncbi:MAG: hypothetical protein IH989_04415 [Planctomycetes bacterium]|nr:hypothetical protein [Planctomycetota bacterium]
MIHARKSAASASARRISRVILCVGLATGAAVAQDNSAEAARKRINDILTNLQARSDGLRDIRCKVRFVEDDRINLSKRIKDGTLQFMMSDPNPYFLVHFKRIEVDGLRGKQEWYLFTGRWLYQAIQRLKQVTKHELVPPGEKIDLFDLEKAPFPVPFGHKKGTILRHFDVTLLPPAKGDPPGTDHLVCKPKPMSALKRRYDKLELFVSRDVHLPSRIVVTRNDGLEVNTADFPDLSNASINVGLSDKDFAKPKAWRKYEEVVEKLPAEE